MLIVIQVLYMQIIFYFGGGGINSGSIPLQGMSVYSESVQLYISKSCNVNIMCIELSGNGENNALHVCQYICSYVSAMQTV